MLAHNSEHIHCIGMGDVHCGMIPATFRAGSLATSVKVPTMNDEESECDETFTAQIKLEEGISGFRLGLKSKVTVTVKDDEGTQILV